MFCWLRLRKLKRFWRFSHEAKRRRRGCPPVAQTALGKKVYAISNGGLVLRSRKKDGRFLVAQKHFASRDLIFKERSICICSGKLKNGGLCKWGPICLAARAFYFGYARSLFVCVFVLENYEKTNNAFSPPENIGKHKLGFPPKQI